MKTLQHLKQEIRKYADKKKAKILQRFFKTGKGEYGEGDVFLGLTVPVQRRLVRDFKELRLADAEKLLHSGIHEHRLIALLILVEQFKRRDAAVQRAIYALYLRNTRWINNWDIVDLTAPNIVGRFLLDKPRDILYKLARSGNLWERRIAMLSTFAFIRNGDCADALKIAAILVHDPHDLIHKAVGWMLREVGKRDRDALKRFLNKYHATMPRTMLRYALERFDEHTRLAYLKKGRTRMA